MPLVEPDALREKILLIAPGKVGKTTSWASIAWWAHISKDPRSFFVFDTDDEAVLHVLNESKYDGMLRSVNGEVVNPEGNIVLYTVNKWDSYLEALDKILPQIRYEGNRRDWIVVDFITHAWAEVQEAFLRDEVNKTKSEAMRDAYRAGLSGWDMFRTDYNYQVINPMYFEWFKAITVESRCHVFLCAEQDEIPENANRLSQDQKDHLQKFGRFKAIGQKKLPYQCRSYLRMQRLARGRVLTTQGDRARKEFDNDEVKDFMQDYLVGAAKWKVVDPD